MEAKRLQDRAGLVGVKHRIPSLLDLTEVCEDVIGSGIPDLYIRFV